MLDGLEATALLPDFIDGETKDFELYWDDDGSAVSLTETDENLLVALNGVIKEQSTLSMNLRLMHISSISQ